MVESFKYLPSQIVHILHALFLMENSKANSVITHTFVQVQVDLVQPMFKAF